MFNGLACGRIGVRVGFEESVELAARFGFEGVALDTGYAMENGPEAVVRMLEEKGLQSAGWGLPMRLVGPDEDFKTGLGKLGEVAAVCARVGDLRCSTWVPSASDEMPYDDMFAYMRDRLAAIGQVFKEHNVRLGLEFLGPLTIRAGKKYEFVHTMEGMLELGRAAGTGNVSLLLDCWHLYTSGAPNDDVLNLTDDDIVSVHINDAPTGIPLEEHRDNARALPGETGVIDVPQFMEYLKQIGYTGAVIVEPFSERVKQMEPLEAIRATKESIDSVWPD